MKMLEANERFRRYGTGIGDLQALEGDLAGIAEQLTGACDEDEFAYLNLAALALSRAMKALREAERLARRQCEPELLREELQASLELIAENPARFKQGPRR